MILVGALFLATPRQRKRHVDHYFDRSGGQFFNFSNQALEAFFIYPLLYFWNAGPRFATACRAKMSVLTETFKHLAADRTNPLFFLGSPGPLHVTDTLQKRVLLTTYL